MYGLPSCEVAPARIQQPEKGHITKQLDIMKVRSMHMIKDIRTAAGQSAVYQRKIIPWHFLALDEADDRDTLKKGASKLPMVVCASLLDKPPNLGGLTRTCEVFGLQAITLPDKAVMQTKVISTGASRLIEP
jgi:tRNA G18 (ribose-2'-O)-methylase SpoU